MYCQDMTVALTTAWSAARRRMQDGVMNRDWDTPVARKDVRIPQYVIGQGQSLCYTYLDGADIMNVIDKSGNMDQVHVDRLRLYRRRGQEEPARRYDQMVTREREAREARAREEERKRSGSEEKRSGDDEERGATSPDGGSERSEEMEAEESEFEVEEIVDKRVHKTNSRLSRKGQVQYQVKWRGYDDSHNTWEAVDQLRNCMEAVREYEERREGEG